MAKFRSYLEAQRGRLRRVPEPADLDEAIRFERAEAKAYRHLRALAQGAGDRATAELCEANLADEVAMAMTLEKLRMRFDPGFRRGGESPFATPAKPAAVAPET
jgi:ferritin-like protein